MRKVLRTAMLRAVFSARAATIRPPKADVKSAKCETGRGSMAKEAEKTADLDINPHDSHIEGAQCLEWHQGHKKPQLLCDQCHEFRGMRVP